MPRLLKMQRQRQGQGDLQVETTPFALPCPTPSEGDAVSGALLIFRSLYQVYVPSALHPLRPAAPPNSLWMKLIKVPNENWTASVGKAGARPEAAAPLDNLQGNQQLNDPPQTQNRL